MALTTVPAATGAATAPRAPADELVDVDAIWLLHDPATDLPLRLDTGRLALTVDADVDAVVDLDTLTRALTDLEDTPGTDLHITVVDSDDIVGGGRDDRSRVHVLDDCDRGRGSRLARARLWADGDDGHYATIDEVDIGICARLGDRDRDRQWLALRHEAGHAVGLGHVCPATMADCHRAGMPPDPHTTVARLMYPLTNERQRTLHPDDVALLAGLYPATAAALPRVCVITTRAPRAVRAPAWPTPPMRPGPPRTSTPPTRAIGASTNGTGSRRSAKVTPAGWTHPVVDLAVTCRGWVRPDRRTARPGLAPAGAARPRS